MTKTLQPATIRDAGMLFCSLLQALSSTVLAARWGTALLRCIEGVCMGMLADGYQPARPGCLRLAWPWGSTVGRS